MDATPSWPAMAGFTDGQNVDAATLNRPLQQLASRTELLWRLLVQNDRTKVSIDVEISGDTPTVGQPVYRVGSDGTFAKAIGAVGNNEWFYADGRAMAVGVVSAISGPTATTATVVLCGYLALPGDGVAVGSLIDDPSPVSGRYYLSNYNAGKLTANPSGPVIYVCDCYIEGGMVKSMIVNPQYRDTGESHVHRSFVLDWKPQGGYSAKFPAGYSTFGCTPDDFVIPSSGLFPGALRMYISGAWDTDEEIEYVFRLERKTSASAGSTNWEDYHITCTSSGDTVSGWSMPLDDFTGDISETKTTETKAVGTHQMKVKFVRAKGALSSCSPDQLVADATRNTWTVTMPGAGRGWIGTSTGSMLNLGMYPALSRYVPLVPENSGSLVVGGLEMRGPVFGESKREWYIAPASSIGGPWLMWVGKAVDGVNTTTPWVHSDPDVAAAIATERHIVLHIGRMRVGPTGFVTSLQPAPGSPLKVTSALTDTDAVQGALQIGLDINFKSSAGNVAGSQVVKRINGSTFETGPVVERIIAGPGMAVSQEQGIVRVSASNAVYAGDFETIALKNAKQDLAAGVFPYTKLLGPGIASGFTAKFRVPDHIPYGKYYVVVSASVFGEDAITGASRTASFKLKNYVLADRACSESDATSSPTLDGSIDSPAAGYEATIGVPFPESYAAFNPILMHGFGTIAGSGPGSIVLPDMPGQRHSDAYLWLHREAASDKLLEVYPGYFVGLDIQRCTTSGTDYTGAIGFLSLRWNLVEA